MEKFKVIDPKGVLVNGVLKEKGETITLAKGAERNAFLHFKQVKPVEAKAEDPEAAAKAKADADLKAKQEAEAKAKAEAAAKK